MAEKPTFASVVRNRGFRFLWLNQILVQLGDNIINFALIIWVFKLTDSTLAVSGLLLAIYLPVIFFGVFSTPLLSVTFTLGTFLIGHWTEDLLFFAIKSESPVFIGFAKFVSYLLPNLERFNWRAAVTYSDPILASTILKASVYGFAWTSVLLCLAIIIFRRIDFV